MATQTKFTDIALDELRPLAEQRKADGWRYVQTLCTNTENGIDYTVTFNKDGLLDNFRIKGLTKADVVPSISDLYFSAFVFENEVHDLFGVNISGIVIDFGGKFYDLAMSEPMTVISPAQKAAREKAAKVAAAKAAKAAKEAEAAKAPAKTAAEEEAELEAKLAAMDPEKAEKVRRAMAAKKAKAEKEAAEAKAQADAELEAKLAAMDPEKAEKVRRAMAAKAAKEAAQAAENGKGE